MAAALAAGAAGAERRGTGEYHATGGDDVQRTAALAARAADSRPPATVPPRTPTVQA
jgi:hypothetical protein